MCYINKLALPCLALPSVCVPAEIILSKPFRCATRTAVHQQQFSEQLTARQERTEQVVEQTHGALAKRIPLSEPQTQSHQHLTKLSDRDDVEAFLHTFEVITTREAWEREQWAQVLAPFLSEDAQRAYYSLQPPQSEVYDMLKREILARVGLSPLCASQHFKQWTYDEPLPI